MTTGEKITEERKKLQLTQQQFAERLGVTRQAVSRWESDLAFPETDTLIKMSELFGCSIDYLIKYNGGNEAERPAAEVAKEKEDTWQGRNLLNKLPYFEYKSKTTLFGLPLVHVNIGAGRVAKGIFAFGLVSVGFVSAGLVSVGLVAWGLLALGLLSFGSVSVGALALGGVAIGILALGGCAVGCFGFGGCAVGLFSFGGFANGAYIAVGDYAVGGITFGKTHSEGSVIAVTTETYAAQKAEALALIDKIPAFWQPLAGICKNLAQSLMTGK